MGEVLHTGKVGTFSTYATSKGINAMANGSSEVAQVENVPWPPRLLAHRRHAREHEAEVPPLRRHHGPGVIGPRPAEVDHLHGPPREARRLSDDPITLEDLSTEFGVSRERVRQIEVRAFEKIQEAVKKNLAQIEEASPETAV